MGTSSGSLRRAGEEPAAPAGRPDAGRWLSVTAERIARPPCAAGAEQSLAVEDERALAERRRRRPIGADLENCSSAGRWSARVRRADRPLQAPAAGALRRPDTVTPSCRNALGCRSARWGRPARAAWERLKTLATPLLDEPGISEGPAPPLKAGRAGLAVGACSTPERPRCGDFPMTRSGPRDRHLDFATTLDYLDQRLDASRGRESKNISAVLPGVPRCARSADCSKPCAATARAKFPHLHQRALDVFTPRAWRSPVRRALETLAELVFDSLTSPLPTAHCCCCCYSVGRSPPLPLPSSAATRSSSDRARRRGDGVAARRCSRRPTRRCGRSKCSWAVERRTARRTQTASSRSRTSRPRARTVRERPGGPLPPPESRLT